MQYNFLCRKRGKTWQIVLSYKDASGKWRQTSRSGFPTKSEASRDEVKERMLDEIRVTADIPPEAAGMTLADFLPIYFKGKPDLAENTARAYAGALARLGELKYKPLTTITYADVSMALAALDGTPKSRRQVYVIAKLLFTAARRYGFINASPMQDLTFKIREDEAGKVQRVRTMTDEEIGTLLEKLKARDKEAYVLGAIAAYTGVRRGELVAIRWDDIDFARMTLTISKQMTKGRDGAVIKRVKSKNSTRTVPLPPPLIQILKEYRWRAVQYMHRRLTRFDSPDIIGQRIRLAMPGHSLHDLRHTYATKLIASGRVDIKTAAALLGDSIGTVERVYLHYTDDMRAKAAADVEAIFLTSF